jgi:hypothetical protein
MSALMCSRPGCPTNAMPVRVDGVWTDPPGWTNATVTGRPIRNLLLCPSCATEVRAVLAAGPGVVERAAEAAFGRGYVKGQEDTLELTGAGRVPDGVTQP